MKEITITLTEDEWFEIHNLAMNQCNQDSESSVVVEKLGDVLFNV